ncbi:MAG: type II toxin-antitoxin system RelE/ParE family toxin [Novosphingobium sp.]
MKRKLVYRPDALTDLDEVEAYSRRTWGNEQAKRYVAALVADIKALRLSALRHPLYDAIHPGLRRRRSAMHHSINSLRFRTCAAPVSFFQGTG